MCVADSLSIKQQVGLYLGNNSCTHTRRFEKFIAHSSFLSEYGTSQHLGNEQVYILSLLRYSLLITLASTSLQKLFNKLLRVYDHHNLRLLKSISQRICEQSQALVLLTLLEVPPRSCKLRSIETARMQNNSCNYSSVT